MTQLIIQRFMNTKRIMHTSANWIFPVSTRSLASEHRGTECLTTGWRFKISVVWKGAAELRSYLRAAIVIPTCKGNHKQVTGYSRSTNSRASTYNRKLLIAGTWTADGKTRSVYTWFNNTLAEADENGKLVLKCHTSWIIYYSTLL